MEREKSPKELFNEINQNKNINQLYISNIISLKKLGFNLQFNLTEKYNTEKASAICSEVIDIIREDDTNASSVWDKKPKQTVLSTKKYNINMVSLKDLEIPEIEKEDN